MRIAVLAGLLALTVPAQAQDAYVDDRSTPAAVVKSLYNAIGRREYARAYGYFRNPPAASIEAYARGYEDTDQVRVLTGAPAEEGAAGSMIYTLPVAIEATATNGEQRVFAGCYTLRMATPQLQEDAFSPLGIEKGALRASQAEFEKAVPTKCGDEEMPAWDPALETAKTMFAAAAPAFCKDGQLDAFEEDRTPQVYPVSFRYDYETDADPEHVLKLIRFFCNRGAYNEVHIYYLADEYGEVNLLQFAEPTLDIRYQDDDHEKAVEDIRVVGFTAKAELINSFYDENSRTISESAKWRGVGDASSGATWAFHKGKFRLVRYDVDATYDGEIEPETIIDYETAP